jgi:uncharacterized phage-associated protein
MANRTEGIVAGGTAATSAQNVAHYLVSVSQRYGDPITNLKLQKLLYYAQGWYLVLYGRRLFREQIQAWLRGPVVYEVWKEFSGYQWRPIRRRVSEPPLSGSSRDFLDSVYSAYQGYSAYHLEKMTHSESPWLIARRGLGNKEPSNAVIAVKDIEAHFSKLMHAPSR